MLGRILAGLIALTATPASAQFMLLRSCHGQVEWQGAVRIVFNVPFGEDSDVPDLESGFIQFIVPREGQGETRFNPVGAQMLETSGMSVKLTLGYSYPRIWGSAAAFLTPPTVQGFDREIAGRSLGMLAPLQLRVRGGGKTAGRIGTLPNTYGFRLENGPEILLADGDVTFDVTNVMTHEVWESGRFLSEQIQEIVALGRAELEKLAAAMAETGSCPKSGSAPG